MHWAPICLPCSLPCSAISEVRKLVSELPGGATPREALTLGQLHAGCSPGSQDSSSCWQARGTWQRLCSVGSTWPAWSPAAQRCKLWWPSSQRRSGRSASELPSPGCSCALTITHTLQVAVLQEHPASHPAFQAASVRQHEQRHCQAVTNILAGVHSSLDLDTRGKQLICPDLTKAAGLHPWGHMLVYEVATDKVLAAWDISELAARLCSPAAWGWQVSSRQLLLAFGGIWTSGGETRLLAFSPQFQADK